MAHLSARAAPALRHVSLAAPAARPAVAAAAVCQKRHNHDLVIKRLTGKPIIKSGPYGGGRSSVSGQIATVFGCTGFLGRYLVNRLAQKGTQVVVPYRDEDEKRHLKLMGDLGQVVPLEWDIRNLEQIEECLRHSDTVYNLVGRDWETKNFKFEDVHVTGARLIAEIAQANGVSRFIHVSHLNADPESESVLYRAKAAGEEAVKKAFEGATIVRPSTMFGHEDRLLNTMAVYPFSYRVNHGRTRVRPVHSLNVAAALEVMMNAEETSIGSTFTLDGPREYTYEELLDIVERFTFNKTSGLNVPRPAMKLLANAAELLWWPTLSPDEVTRRYINDKPVEPGTKSWADLAIEPDVLEDVAIAYLRRYRSDLYFDLPIRAGGVQAKQKAYHVVD